MRSKSVSKSKNKIISSLLRAGVCMVFLLLAVFILQCSIKKPTAPYWNTKLTLPLISKHYDMATLIDKMNDPHLLMDSLGNPYFCLEEKLDTTQIREHLSLSAVSKSFNDTLGSIELSSSEASRDTMKLADIYAWETGALPDTDLAVSLELETIQSFAQATVQSGSTTIQVENQLGVDFDYLVVYLVDSVTSSVVATFVFPNGISDAESESQTADLVPQTVSNRLYYDIHAHTPGGTIFSSSGKYLSLELSIDHVVASQGRAQIPSIPLEKNDTLGFAPSDVTIDSAEIESGSIFLHLNNFSNLDARVEVKLPDFVFEGGALTINRNIVAGATDDVNIELGGYGFIPGVEGALRVEVDALVESSGTELVAFTSSDSIRLDATSSEIVFSSISGRIPQTEVQIPSMQRQLDLPEGFKNIQLTNASLELVIFNGLDLPVDFSVLVQADNQKELNLSGYAQRGSADDPSRTVIVNADLSQFLDPIPENIVITGTALCGEETNLATITKDDFVFAQVKIISPLQFIMGASDVEIESTSHQLTDEVRDLLTGNLNWGRITLDATNHLPLGASIELYISADAENLFTNPDLTIGPIDLACGLIGQDGLVEEATTSNNVIQLDSEEMQIFENRPFYIAGNLHLPGTNGEEVRAINLDYLDVAAHLELEISNKQ